MKPYFEVKTKMIFGEGKALNIHKYIKELGFKNPDFIMDMNVAETDYGNEIIGNDINCLFYDYGEPTYNLLEQWRECYEDKDCVVGIGGGSVMDYAKGVAFLATNKNKAISYRGFPKNINKPLPVITIPTTAGTGSEVTYNAVFTDSKEKKKLGINTKHNYPILTILDPKLLISCPKNIIISTGMDGIIHSIEGWASKKSNKISKVLFKNAYKFFINNIQNSANNSNDLKSKSNMMIGAYLAGLALPNAGAGPAGALGYILGPKFNVPHGLAGAVFLPHIVDYNESREFTYDLQNNYTLYVTLHMLYEELEIPNNLIPFGVNESNVNILVDELESLQPIFNQNPIPFTIEDAKRIIMEMI